MSLENFCPVQMRRMNAAVRKDQDAVTKAAKEDAIKAKVDALKQEFPYLQVGNSVGTAAKNIRVLLKRSFPKTNFYVRCTWRSGISI